MENEVNWHDDILKHLQHIDGIPTCMRNIEVYFESVKQAICRAADEIERLRKENKELRRKMKCI